jgi:CheY-like chemotaxis protein
MKKFTVFVLDDDEPFCGLLLAIARRYFVVSRLEGYEIVLKTHHDMEDIEGAINWIKENKPDLVLLDYMLGTELSACLNSLDVLKKIIPYCANIKILTGLWSEDIRLKLIKEGLDRMHIKVIQKPFDTDDLLQIIKDAFKIEKETMTKKDV